MYLILEYTLFREMQESWIKVARGAFNGRPLKWRQTKEMRIVDWENYPCVAFYSNRAGRSEGDSDRSDF